MGEERDMQSTSAFGFRNVRPIGREEYFHFEEPLSRADGGVGAAGPGTVGWIPEAERFANDVAGQEKVEQQARRQAEERFWDARRDANVNREERRWEKMEDQERHQMAIDANCAV